MGKRYVATEQDVKKINQMIKDAELAVIQAREMCNYLKRENERLTKMLEILLAKE
jgi:cell shape-determining protein MreC